MARRMHGLIGPGTGPKLCVGEATRLQAEVRGIRSGRVFAKTFGSDGIVKEVRIISKDGLHEITLGDWVQFECEGTEMTICSLRVY